MADPKKPSTFSKILGTAFPFLTMGASVFGGPAAGALTTKLGEALGVNKPNPSAPELEAAYLNATPDQLTAARKVELDFQARMKEIDIDTAEKMVEFAAADRADARQREIKTGDVWTPRILAAIVLVAWIAVQFYVLPHAFSATKAPDPSMMGAVNRMLGTLDAALTLVLAYYFGSSIGSARKNDMLAQAGGPKA